jgi:hypothetical protein
MPIEFVGVKNLSGIVFPHFNRRTIEMAERMAIMD